MILVKTKKKQKKQKNSVFPKICRQKVMLQFQMTIDSWIFEINTIQATKRLKITQTFRISKNILSLSIFYHFTTINIKIGHFQLILFKIEIFWQTDKLWKKNYYSHNIWKLFSNIHSSTHENLNKTKARAFWSCIINKFLMFPQIDTSL